jgi:hypothetical protein
VALAHELADVPLARLAELGGAGIAKVRVVRPDGDPRRRGATAAEMTAQRLERLDHVAVAQVPRFDPAAEHPPVVAFGVLHQARVLLGVEARVVVAARRRARPARRAPRAARAAARRPRPRSSATSRSGSPRRTPARRRDRRRSRRSGGALVRRLAGPRGRGSEHCVDRGEQAVQVDAVEPTRSAGGRARCRRAATRRNRAPRCCATSRSESGESPRARRGRRRRRAGRARSG